MKVGRVEGLGVVSSSDNQYVHGKYNIEDTSNQYAEIVGNGLSDTERSNAYTLDWNGNAVYSGKVTAGEDPVSGLDLATKQYVDGITTMVPYEHTEYSLASALVSDNYEFTDTFANHMYVFGKLCVFGLAFRCRAGDRTLGNTDPLVVNIPIPIASLHCQGQFLHGSYMEPFRCVIHNNNGVGTISNWYSGLKAYRDQPVIITGSYVIL